MNERQALAEMYPPGKRRPGKRHGGILQIWITRRCDRCCYHCTQGSNLRGSYTDITVEQFEKAVLSLKGYFGIVGLLGGNPCVHPRFPEICGVVQKHLPQGKCGLWANRAFGHAALCRRTFSHNFSNINVHLDNNAAREWKTGWPEVKVWGERNDSRHGPTMTALKDLIEGEERRWDLISRCDINRYWSAMIGVFRGELRGWFCEIAGAHSILHQDDPNYPDTGLPIGPGWWNGPMEDFAHQARFHCHECGVPLRGKGELSSAPNGTELVTGTHQGIYHPKVPSRWVKVVRSLKEVSPQSLPRLTQYLQNARRKV